MANRLTQIATRTGDDGTTGLGDGSRAPKDDLRVQAMGDVDELNSTLGRVAGRAAARRRARTCSDRSSTSLFDLGGELSIPGYTLLKAEAVMRLDDALAHYNARPAATGRVHSAGRRRAARRLRMWRGPSRAAQSARWWRSALSRGGQRGAAPLPEPLCPTCCSCSRGCLTAPTSTGWVATMSIGGASACSAAVDGIARLAHSERGPPIADVTKGMCSWC